MANWNKIKEAVENNGNVLTVTMEQLRDVHGAGKLGKYVKADISSALAGLGLGHVPPELPGYQHELVRLYKMGTQVADAITTALTPGQRNDAKLVEQFGDGDVEDYAAIVQKIRELVAE